MKKIILLFVIIFSVNLSAQDFYKFTIDSKYVKFCSVDDSLENSSKVLYVNRMETIKIYKNSSKVILGKISSFKLSDEELMETIDDYKNMDGVDGLVGDSLIYKFENGCVEFYYYQVYKICTGCLSMSGLLIDKEDWTINLGDKEFTIHNLKFK